MSRKPFSPEGVTYYNSSFSRFHFALFRFCNILQAQTETLPTPLDIEQQVSRVVAYNNSTILMVDGG